MEDLKKDCGIFGIQNLSSNQEDAIKYVAAQKKRDVFVNLPTRLLFWEKDCDCYLPITNSFWIVLLEYHTVRYPFSLTLK